MSLKVEKTLSLTLAVTISRHESSPSHRERLISFRILIYLLSFRTWVFCPFFPELVNLVTDCTPLWPTLADADDVVPVVIILSLSSSLSVRPFVLL